MRTIAVIASTCIVATIAGCGSSDSSSYDPFADVQGDGRGVIGPAGGSVEVAEATNPIAGVKVTIPAGALSERWIVDISYRTMFSTADYPDGFGPFERPGPSGSLTIELSGSTSPLPDTIPMEISFPLQKIAQDKKDEILAAYYYDSDGEWQVRLPIRVSDTEMVIKNDRRHVRWSWGRIDLWDVDFERYVRPAMVERHGDGTIADLEKEMQRVQDEIAKLGLQNTCLKLGIVQDFLAALEISAEKEVDRIQASFDCGQCDLKSKEFYTGIAEYFMLMLAEEPASDIAGRLAGKLPLGFILGPLAEMAVCVAFEAAMKSLPCDYECFFETSAPEMMTLTIYLGEYWVAHFGAVVLENYMRSLSCP